MFASPRRTNLAVDCWRFSFTLPYCGIILCPFVLSWYSVP
jgi:hypothetical protein